jgi:hypothetical protein
MSFPGFICSAAPAIGVKMYCFAGFGSAKFKVDKPAAKVH